MRVRAKISQVMVGGTGLWNTCVAISRMAIKVPPVNSTFHSFHKARRNAMKSRIILASYHSASTQDSADFVVNSLILNNRDKRNCGTRPGLKPMNVDGCIHRPNLLYA